MDIQEEMNIIGTASGGAALCAYRVDEAAGKASCMRPLRSSRQVLQSPKECRLQGPQDQMWHCKVEFTTDTKLQEFREAAKNFGWNAALHLLPPLTMMRVEHGASLSESNEQFSEADKTYKMEVLYLPLKSFRVKRSHMQLSKEAVADLEAVRNWQQASSFLSRYYSHVSTGIHHLGAIRFAWFTSQNEARKTHQLRKSATSSKADASLSVPEPYSGLLAGNIGVGVQKETHSADLNKVSKQKATSYNQVQILGGTMSTSEDIKEFLKSTEATPSSWAIINSEATGVDNLVPIWDLALQSGVEGLQKPAHLLREVWQSSVASLVHEGQGLFELHQASIVSAIVSKEETPYNTERIIKALQDMEKNPRRICEDFTELWVSVPYEQRRELISLPAFARLVFMVKSIDGMEPARQLLQDILQSLPAAGEILSKTGVTLEVRPKCYQSYQQPQFLPHAPGAHKIAPEELPDKLLQIIATPACSSQPDSLSAIDSLTIAQENAICNLLKKCIITNASDHSAIPHISALISQYGFESNGEACLWTPQKPELMDMVKELRPIVTGMNASSSCLTKLEDLEPQESDPMQPETSVADSSMSLDNSLQAASELKAKEASKFTFVNDFMMYGPFPPKNKFKNLIERLTHGLGMFQDSQHEVFSENTEFWDEDDEEDAGVCNSRSSAADPEEGSYIIEEADAAQCLVYIYENADTPAKIALLRLLLDQRWGVPLVYGFTSTSGNLECFHTMEALDCVVTTIRAETFNFDLIQDSSLPRVVFISSHQASQHELMAKHITESRFLPFCCKRNDHTLHSMQGLKGDFGPGALDECSLYMQLGMGFLKIQKPEGFPDLKPYVAIVVSGVLADKACIDFLNETADMIILQLQSHELGNNTIAMFQDLTCKTVLRWAISSAGASGVNRAKKEIWGSADHVGNEIRRLMLAKFVKGGQMNFKVESRRNLRNISTEYFRSRALIIDQHLWKEGGLEDAISQTDFRNLKEQLILQKSFLIEANARFESLKLEHDKGQKQLKLRECYTQQQKRKENVEKVARIPIVQYFLRVMRHTEAAARVKCIIKLQHLMQEKSQQALEELNQKVLLAFQTFENNSTEEASAEYNGCKKTYAENEVGMVNMWREVCHIFLANPRKYSELPRLAARHLIDGFPLEILDGDAKFFSELWVATVLQEAEQLIKESLGFTPKVLILSVLGTQSSGKSTLLNVMFGTQLRTRAGQCTRGVHIQLVRSVWPQYDYILLIDTEGIRCPENYSEEGYLSHDNRLATFAILPADACIMVVSNEEDRSLKEVLPMVLLAFRGSAAAEKSGGRLRSKLLFVYRSVSLNDPSELWPNQQTLFNDLIEAERKIINPKSTWSLNKNGDGGEETSSAIAQHFRGARFARLFDFHVDFDENLSDVRFFGNLKKSSKPPEDFPDSRFGEKVLQLREYLHKRVTQSSEWKPFDLKEFSSYMSLVWRCIWHANFELSFGDAVQYHTFLELQEALQEPRLMVIRAYVEEKGELEKLSQDRELIAQNSHQETTSGSIMRMLKFEKVSTTIREQTIRVEKILSQERYLQWKGEQHQNWELFLSQQDTWFNLQLKDFTMGVVLLDNLVKEYNNRLLHEIMAMRDGDRETIIPFEDLFTEILSHAQEQHKPLAHRVRKLVDEVYKRHRNIHRSPISEGEDSENRKQTGDILLSDLLEKYVAPSLKIARQYSDDLVEEAINLTNTFIEKHPLFYGPFRSRIAYAHAGVSEFVISELSKAQQHWDEQHNPAEKLRQQKDHFQCFYNNHMSRCDMTERFTEDLKSVFRQNLKSTLQNSLVKVLSESLEKAEWLSNWRVMRKLLDTFLLKLLLEWKEATATSCRHEGKSKAVSKVVTLIDYVSDDALFHKIMVEQLIMKTIKETANYFLGIFHDKIKHAVSYATACAVIDVASGRTGVTQIFLDKLAEALKNDMPACRNTLQALSQISPVAYSAGAGREGPLEFREIVLPGLHGEVDEIYDEFLDSMQEGWPVNGLRGIADKVNEALQRHDNETFRSRCKMACPLCGAACFLPAFHNESHDTLHQAQGFKGVIWQHNRQLSEKSCAEHYRDEDEHIQPLQEEEEEQICKPQKDYQRLNSYRNFKTGQLSFSSFRTCRRRRRRIVPATRTESRAECSSISYEQLFEEEFPDWKRPMASHDTTHPSTCRVRQCIFFHCQTELVKRFPAASPNDQIDHFVHDMAALRFALERELPKDLLDFVEATDLADL